MVTISTDNAVATLINVFTVAPEHQQTLIDLLVEATSTTMRHVPGFISASFHKSADGTRVVNYAQWRRAKDFDAMLQNPKAREHMKPIQDLATNDAHIYTVVESVSE